MIDVNAADDSPIIVASDPKTAARSRFSGLTKREREIALRVARGERQSQMSKELGISTKTIQTHRERALVALGVRTNQELAILAFMAGYISAP